MVLSGLLADTLTSQNHFQIQRLILAHHTALFLGHYIFLAPVLKRFRLSKIRLQHFLQYSCIFLFGLVLSENEKWLAAKKSLARD